MVVKLVLNLLARFRQTCTDGESKLLGESEALLREIDQRGRA
jgi:hypothetical protein